MIIKSSKNNLVKKLICLKQKKFRQKYNLFLVEGIKSIDEIPSIWNIELYVVSESFEKKYSKKIEQLESKAKVYTVIDNIFESISNTDTPQGILALCQQKIYTISDTINDNPFIIIADNLQNPGNLGTIIRTADAANATGVLLSQNTVDLYNPKTLGATMGSIFHIPIVQNVNINETISILKQNNITVICSDLKANMVPYSIDLKKPIALIVGNESNGVSKDVLEQADILVKIPLIGKAESLNVSIASGILLYEVVRQRLQTAEV